MSPLQSALNRLYFASEPIRQNGNTQTPAGGAADGRVRAMVLEHAKPADLAGIFTDEPWLDLEPTPDAQIRLLSRFECIQPAAAAATSPVAPVASEPPTDWAAPSAIATHAKSLGP